MSRLLRYALRILVDPATALEDGGFFSDVDELAHCLQEWASPCRIILLFPESAFNVYKARLPFHRHVQYEVLPSVQEPSSEVASALAGIDGTQAEVQALASMAHAGDGDIVLSSRLAAQPEIASKGGRRF